MIAGYSCRLQFTRYSLGIGIGIGIAIAIGNRFFRRTSSIANPDCDGDPDADSDLLTSGFQ